MPRESDTGPETGAATGYIVPLMRPDILTPCFADIASLKGVGPKIARDLERLAGPRLVDLLWHLPTGTIDRGYRPPLAQAQEGRVATLSVIVDSHDAPPRGSRRPYRVTCHDDSGEIALIFFHARADYLRRLLPEGARRLVSGTVERFRDQLQMAHPDHVVPPEQADEIPLKEPIYPLTAGLSQRVLGRAVRAAVSQAPEMPEWLDDSVLSARKWPAWRPALRRCHELEQDGDPQAARDRLAYDELLASQLALHLVRRAIRRPKGRSHLGDGRLRARVRAALPYALTGDQQTALAEIEGDLGADMRMMRLLQGDVGGGKTVVALLAMLAVVEQGHQAALLAPTEVLARQHYDTLAPLCAAAGVELTFIVGSQTGAVRRQAREALAEGSAAIAVGTHAVFQEQVQFHDLAFAAIDEQHRFGVSQRLLLAGKGTAVDVLVMTATPIPRTLTLAVYGDMDVSRIREKPPGRAPIATRSTSLARLDQVVERLRAALTRDERAYWICPMVEESDLIDAASVEERTAMLRQTLGESRVGMVHGRQAAEVKADAIDRFRDGTTPVLVATTVVEVGVDAPDATIIIVENAERFGLAQLHQLRGRVGRGNKPGSCLLLHAPDIGETARARLDTLIHSDDGFFIAEEDLRLRGAGDVLGTRQSGLPQFRVAEIENHGDLMQMAHDDARLILERDPDLKSPRGTALRTLLYLFQRDEAVRNLRSG